jgi:hypothetical protein
VPVDEEISFMTEIPWGTVQGSIRVPVLYVIYISPLFDLEFIRASADDNYISRFSNSLLSVLKEMEEVLETVNK